jgi:hypothetical protein
MAEPLTDLASVREFMQETTADAFLDPDLETLIVQASEAITGFCDREFSPSDNETRSFEFQPTGNGLDLLSLAPFEVREVSVVMLDPEASGGTEVEANRYRVWPFPARDGTFFGLRLLGLGFNCSPFFTRRVDVTGDWGMAAVPAEVKHWANVTVESWAHLRRDAGVGMAEVQIEGDPPARADDLPPAVRWALRRRWKRPDFPA